MVGFKYLRQDSLETLSKPTPITQKRYQILFSWLQCLATKVLTFFCVTNYILISLTCDQREMHQIFLFLCRLWKLFASKTSSCWCSNVNCKGYCEKNFKFLMFKVWYCKAFYNLLIFIFWLNIFYNLPCIYVAIIMG